MYFKDTLAAFAYYVGYGGCNSSIKENTRNARVDPAAKKIGSSSFSHSRRTVAGKYMENVSLKILLVIKFYKKKVYSMSNGVSRWRLLVCTHILESIQ